MISPQKAWYIYISFRIILHHDQKFGIIIFKLTTDWPKSSFKAQIARKRGIFLTTSNGRSGYGWQLELEGSWFQVESRRSNGWIAKNLVGKSWAAFGLFQSIASHHCTSSLTAAIVPLSASLRAAGLARVSVGGRESLHPVLAMADAGRRKRRKKKKKGGRRRSWSWGEMWVLRWPMGNWACLVCNWSSIYTQKTLCNAKIPLRKSQKYP